MRLSNTRQTFHPGIGPLAEANILHVQQQQLLERCNQTQKFIIWDVGFGASANAIVALEALKNCQSDIEIYSFDRSLDPIHFAIEHASELEYILPYLAPVQELIEKKMVQVTPHLRWHLEMGDFREEMLRSDIPRPNAIFYDPYSLTINIGEKEETSIATNQLALLTKPLDQKWLERVKISQSANPIRGTEQIMSPISAEDFELLKKHPQFQI